MVILQLSNSVMIALTPDQTSQAKAGIVVEFRKERSQPMDQLEQFGRRKRKLRFSLKVSREKPDEQG